MEYFFCDTHKELPETYEYLDRIKARLGIKIEFSADRGFDHWMSMVDSCPHPRCAGDVLVQIDFQPLAQVLADVLDNGMICPCLVIFSQ